MGPVSFEHVDLGSDRQTALELAGALRVAGIRVESVQQQGAHSGLEAHSVAVIRSSDVPMARTIIRTHLRDPLPIEPLDRPPDTAVSVPGSKSHTNRALICAALAHGRSVLERILMADDTEALLAAVTELGASVHLDGDRVEVEGTGGVIRSGPVRLDARKSGTTSRFLLPMLATGNGPYVLDGEAQLRARPFDDQVDAMATLGADIEGRSLPLTVTGGAAIGGETTIDGSTSSQFLSGLLLSAPCFSQPTTVRVTGQSVSRPYIDLTLATMGAFGAAVTEAGDRFEIGNDGYQAATVAIEPDASAASYFFAAAALTGGRLRVNGLTRSAVQGDVAFVDVLKQMGAEVTADAEGIEVRGTDRLRGITVDMSDISDTVQSLAVVATAADGPTRMTNIGFIRAKETDRISAVATELGRLGIRTEEEPDALVVHPGVPKPGVVQTYEDHRMAMSFALLGLCHPGIQIADPACVAKTFPTYFDVLEQLRH